MRPIGHCLTFLGPTRILSPKSKLKVGVHYGSFQMRLLIMASKVLKAFKYWIKLTGFDLLSRESIYMKDKQSAAEGDAWVISFQQAEMILLLGGCRRKCLSILKTLRDKHLDLPGKPIENYHMKTLLLYECEKHPREMEWDETCLGDRINGILLQLISCLQNRKCPHYFLPGLDLFRGKSSSSMDNAAKQTWRILRELLTNSRCLEKL